MDYRVTGEALTQSANSIRSKSGSSAPIPWDNLTGFKSAIDSISTSGDGTSDVVIKSSDATGVDLDIADTNGNVLVRFANGHIQTKEFNSENLDVQINGTSILQNSVANIPIASNNTLGVVKVGPGLQVGSSDELKTNPASLSNIKAGTEASKPLAPSMQHAAVFYGLATAAGDTTQSQSANSVGTYTDDAKATIQRMFGLYNRGELIADVTTTENVTEILVNTDLSGQAFRLTKLIAIFSASQSTTGTRDSFYGQFIGFDENNTQQTTSFPSLQYASATSAMFAKVILRVEPGMPITCEAITATSDGNTQNVQAMAKAFVIDYITSFRIYQSGSSKSLIPAGSNLKVYGVRA